MEKYYVVGYLEKSVRGKKGKENEKKTLKITIRVFFLMVS